MGITRDHKLFNLKMYKLYLKHVFTAVFIVAPMMALGLVVVPVALLLVGRGDEVLPKMFRWWGTAKGRLSHGYKTYMSQCPPELYTMFANSFWPSSYQDDELNPEHTWEGLSGETIYKEQRFSSDSKINPNGYLARLEYLALRAPASYLREATLGYTPTDHDVGLVKTTSHVNLSWIPEEYLHLKDHLAEDEISLMGAPGWELRKLLSTDERIWELYLVRPYKLTSKSPVRALRVHLGWKIGPKEHVKFSKEVGLPLAWVFKCSILSKYEPMIKDEGDDHEDENE